MRRAELALVEGEDGCTGGPFRFAGSRPGLDGFVVTAAVGEPFGETTITALGGWRCPRRGGTGAPPHRDGGRRSSSASLRPLPHGPARGRFSPPRSTPCPCGRVPGLLFCHPFFALICAAPTKSPRLIRVRSKPLLRAAAKQKLGQRPDDDDARDEVDDHHARWGWRRPAESELSETSVIFRRSASHGRLIAADVASADDEQDDRAPSP